MPSIALDAGTIKSQVQAVTGRVALGSDFTWETVASGSYVKASTGALLITFVMQQRGENYSDGGFRIVIGGSTYYGQYNWGGYGGRLRAVPCTFNVTGLGAGTHSWTIATYNRGFTVLNPTSSDSGYITDAWRGPSTVHFLEHS